MSPPDELRLVWIDLEMTGLNPATDAILEIAAVVTGPDLVPLVEIEHVVFQGDELLDQMSDRVRQIHTSNGLIDEVRKSRINRADAERSVLKAIAPHVPPGEGILSGSSIHHDWRFLAKFMPRLEQHMHFRQIDIGTIGVLVNAWYGIDYTRPSTVHRAMADVHASLDEMRYYCTRGFKVDLAALTARLKA